MYGNRAGLGDILSRMGSVIPSITYIAKMTEDAKSRGIWKVKYERKSWHKKRAEGARAVMDDAKFSHDELVSLGQQIA